MTKIKTHVLKIKKWNQELDKIEEEKINLLDKIEEEKINLLDKIEKINEAENTQQITFYNQKPPTFS